MHQCQEYIRQNYIVGTPNKLTIQSTALNAAQASAIQSRLSRDAVGYFYSSLVTFADAMRGIQQGFYCWSTVKLYYSAFYSVRSILASNDYCLFYVGKSPYEIACSPGECPLSVAGSTHQAVMNVFARRFASHSLLSQEIDLMSAISWLQEKRNDANYRHAKFPEPNAPSHLESIVACGVRRSLSDYIGDNENLYTFDPDHSIVAFPIAALRAANRDLCDINAYDLAQKETAYLSGLVRDPQGVVHVFHDLVDRHE